LVVSVGVVVIVVLSRRRESRALSARCVSRVDGIPIRVLSTGETVRLLRGMPVESVVGAGAIVAFDESVLTPEVLDVSVVVLELGAGVAPAVLSVC
jgi:hypothetical protein